MRGRGLAAAALGAVIATAALAGCGSDGSSSTTTTTATTSAEAYASGVCSAASTYKTAVTDATSAVTGGKVSKDTITGAASDLEAATTTFLADVKSLGAPNTTAGAQAKQEIDSLATELGQDVDAIKSALSSVSGLTDVPAAATTISTTLKSAKTQLSDTVARLKSLDAKGELQQAFKDSSTCSSLTSSSSS